MSDAMDVISVLSSGSAFKTEVNENLFSEHIPIEHLKRNCQLFLQVSIEEFRRQLETFMLTTLDTMEKQYKESLNRKKDEGDEGEEEIWLEKETHQDDIPEVKLSDSELLRRTATAAATVFKDTESPKPFVDALSRDQLDAFSSIRQDDVCPTVSDDAELCEMTPTLSAAWEPSEKMSHNKTEPDDKGESDSGDEVPKNMGLDVFYHPTIEEDSGESDRAMVGASDMLAKYPLLLKSAPGSLVLPGTDKSVSSATEEGSRTLILGDPADLKGSGANGGPLWCHTCNQSFNDSLPFELHVRGHDLDKKCMKCFYCGKTFASFSNLKRHKKIHTGVRPHVCSFCTRPFLNRSDLVRHWRIHTGERPYRCDICQNAFKYSFNLKTHQQKYHSRD